MENKSWVTCVHGSIDTECVECARVRPVALTSNEHALDIGRELARQFFSKRGNHSEVHLSEVKLAAACTLAAERALSLNSPETPAPPLCDGEVRLIYEHGEPKGVRDAGGYLCFFERVPKWPGQEARYRDELALRARQAEAIATALRGAKETIPSQPKQFCSAHHNDPSCRICNPDGSDDLREAQHLYDEIHGKKAGGTGS